MKVNVTTVAEIAGLLLLVGGGFLLGVAEGAIALGFALLYEARP